MASLRACVQDHVIRCFFNQLQLVNLREVCLWSAVWVSINSQVKEDVTPKPLLVIWKVFLLLARKLF